MTNKYNLLYFYLLIKKNFILFCLLFVFFSLTPIFLIQYQDSKTANLTYSNVKIMNNYQNILSINMIKDKINIFETAFLQAYNEINLTMSMHNNIFLFSDDETLSKTMNIATTGHDFGVLDQTGSVIEISKFKNKYIDKLYNELLLLNMETKDTFIMQYQNEINDVFEENFDFQNFKFFYENKDVDININNVNDNFIVFSDFSANSETFKNNVNLLIKIASNKILENFYKNLEQYLNYYKEKYENLLFLENINKDVLVNANDLHKKNLDLNYNPDKLSFFINSKPLNQFNYGVIFKQTNYKNTFTITQPSISIIIFFSLIISILILFIKDNYLFKRT